MENTLVIGKIYNLKFHEPDENADVEDYLESIAKMSDTYKLIGEGMIPWGKNNCEEYKYYLFKKSDNEIIEVFIDNFSGRNFTDENNQYTTLVFYDCVKVSKANYSTYLNYGDKDFPEFYRPGFHIEVNIELSEDQEW
jgi:hypothetical protein